MEINGIPAVNNENSEVQPSLKVNNFNSSDVISAEKNRLKKACTEFEQIFLKYMVDKMWSSVDIIRGEQTTEKAVWQDFFNSEIARTIAESNITGISDTLYLQLSSVLPSDTVEESMIEDLEEETSIEDNQSETVESVDNKNSDPAEC